MNSVADLSATYQVRAGAIVHRQSRPADYANSVADLARSLDSQRGLLLTSSFEYPGRYTRWDIGFANPPLVLSSIGRSITIEALNERGSVLLPALTALLGKDEHVVDLDGSDDRVNARIVEPQGPFHEEERSKQPTVFSVLRAMLAGLRCDDEPYLGLYGAFGYELTFQFDPIRLCLPRDPSQRDMVLFLPDEILVVDHRRVDATWFSYDFESHGRTTEGMARETPSMPYRPTERVARECDHEPGEYAAGVEVAREHFARGDLFEVVPGQMFFEPCPSPPSQVFETLKARNPAPYGALINLGEAEYLVAASPEMYVRVEGRRIETCPIAGTIARGRDAIEDAERILTLLSSDKETSELTMCTDVDRNDKSRVCIPGSVKVIGRRQIEMYSRVIHTVDHVEGVLREGFDALDGFLAHTWAVTVTGAPKHAAIQFIEDHERSPRCWYGGAIGTIGFNGNMNTGLTLRTTRIKDGIAEVRAGATLLYDSDPHAEEAETRLKASALLDAIRRPETAPQRLEAAPPSHRPCAGLRILMVDHQDSFVHTLAAYLRETGADVATLRSGFGREVLAKEAPDLVVLSPGPGLPADFNLSRTIADALALEIPIFGVCLGLQGIVEYFGGELETMTYPMHGKPSIVAPDGGTLFEGLPSAFTVGRYHSLVAKPARLPSCLQVTARTAEGTIMAVEHVSLPVSAVQFHPESILSLGGDVGRALIRNVAHSVRRRGEAPDSGTGSGAP